MAFFLQILRLLMLFLNVYDSYKTLKIPPPSMRNPSRPSVRGMTQRKRDMKGCLAVWIVWVALALYERLVESFLSLFIPFYDEFKSLVLLFLIVTRARGAEPIYLHLIRPTVKPYTKTLDALLETMLMVSDFLIALSAYPARLAMEWWAKRLEPAYTYATSDESSSDESQVSSSSIVASGNHASIVKNLNSSSENSIGRDNPHPSYLGRSRAQEHVRSHFGSVQAIDGPESGPANPTSSSRYQVWYPPSARRSDEDDGPLALAVSVTEEVTTMIQQNVDEWRQYPAFPSAYPPTPIATTSKVITAAFATSPPRFPPIEEEPPRQVFRKSLLPPRGPLNPSHACDRSDETTFGILPIISNPIFDVDDPDDSLSTEDYENEDEDDFNVSLKTPLQLQGSAKSRPQLHLLVSPRPVSISSVPSRSSALTTVDNGSPLRTTTSSESSPSDLSFRSLASPIVGKKRSHPHSQLRTRVREVEEKLDQDSSDIDPTTTDKVTSLIQGSNSNSSKLQSTVSANDVQESTSNSGNNDTNDQIPKRRRVVRSPSTKAIKPVRRLGKRTSPLTRTRSSGTASASQSRPQLDRQLEVPVVASNRKTRSMTKSLGVV